MKKIFVGLFIAAASFGLFLGDIPQILAQESDIDEFTLEEIIVTAEKREENQQKVPIAMQVISGEDLALEGKDSVDEILKNIANVFINTADDGMRITLRGITDDSMSQDNQHVADSAVAINIDGSFNNMNNAGQNLYDIERVEVLFGPQSTMYGSNAPGGVVNIVTAAPKTDRYSANATIEYGSFDLLNLQGVVNAPVYKDKIALRVAANRSEQGSFVGADTESVTNSARLKTLFQASDNLSFTLTGNWSKKSGGGMMGGSVVPFADQDGSYPDGTPVTDPWTTTGADDEGGNQFDQITESLTGNFDWNTRFGTISFVPSYSESSSEGKGTSAGGGGPPGGPPPGGMSLSSGGFFAAQQAEEEEVYYQEDSNTQKGAELRMTNASDFEWFEWIFGGTYYHSEQSRSTDYEDPATVDTARDTVTKKQALYANITYPTWFNEKLSLTLGYRQSWDRNYSEEIGSPMAGTTGNPEQSSKPDLKYGFEYDASDNMMFYGSFSSSYRIPNAMSPGGSKPEELDSYSAGMKSRWFGNKLQVNVSGYFYDYANKLCSGWKESDYITELDLGGDYMSISLDREGNPSATVEPDGQYPTMDPDTGEIYEFKLHDSQAQGYGAFQSLGLDLQTSWIITSKDRLNFSVSYLNAEWIDLHFHYEWYMYWPDEDYEGVTPVNSPEWSMTASYQHTFTLREYGTLTPSIDMQHKSHYTMLWNPGDADQYGYSYQEPYFLWDISASFYHNSGKWSLNAYVNNITDYAIKRSYMGRTGNEELRLGDPRTYGVSLTVKF